MIHGVGYRRQRRNDRRFTDSTHAIGMGGIRYLDDHGIDHRHVQHGGHAVIQKARVYHVALLVEVILFVERPADALHRSTLDLAFDVAGMNRLASILNRSITQDRHLARVRVHFHIDDVRAHGRPGAAGINTSATRDGAAGGVLTRCDLLEGEATFRIGRVSHTTVFVYHLVDRALPGFGGPLTHLPLDILGRFIRGPARLEGHAAA